MAQIIDGKLLSAQIKEELKEKTKILINEKGIIPGLALLLVGDNPASKSYVSSKEKSCSELGFKSIVERLPDNTDEATVLGFINKWNADETIHGILVQLPIPKQIDEQKVIQSISPKKDVDGFHPESFGRLVIGLPGFVPCTPAGIVEMIKRYKIPTKGKHVVVVGRSNIVGKPIANLMYQKNPDANSIVTICHTATSDLSYYTKQADILIAAVGVPRIIKAEDVKEGVVIIDVGINRVEDSTTEKGYRIVGDVDFENVKNKASAITPVPGGVGLMTVAMLMQNTYKSAAGEVL
ncbi:MAG: bifunctional methylenetetrahydrofolate dehydrogenase/methenyltetrahydrofolate cyclohydrolase FolD [Bacteroidetes bacterium]|nr:MAG: bifunctional methylenetetrahydrofolate dehydrogenase/methenyltetrahydrofolate cyclohydrolase FolD [Bacteroidota bacterium]